MRMLGRRLVTAAFALLLPILLLAPDAAAGSPAPNSPFPDSMAAIGDSITLAFDDCCSYGPHPQDSWSTGDGYPSNGVDSQYQRLAALDESILGHASNHSVPGAKVADTVAQADEAVAQGAQYVTILIGANDVCTGTVASMTPTPKFQTGFEATMSALESGLPQGALVFVSSIPNVFRLWSLFHENPVAELVWSLGHICQSMLAPSRTEAQRQRVLGQEEADNAVLAAVCAQYPNCRWDGGATFDDPFSPAQVSNLDFFHPSQAGQAALATLTWNASWGGICGKRRQLPAPGRWPPAANCSASALLAPG
jgi:lysophospholipase L1-like esterase